jgi:thioredoxin reductase (NADPH)
MLKGGRRIKMNYDVIIIGKGPAGISAALYTVRANLKTLIIGRSESALLKAEKIENYFGFSEVVSGEFLLKEGELQAMRLGAELLEDEVLTIDKKGLFEVTTANNTYYAKTVLLATGQAQTRLRIDNLENFEGKGISYCTTCDGFFYRNLKVGVLGYKDFAIHEALELTTFTRNITIFTNGMELDITDKYKEEFGKFKIDHRPVLKVGGSEFLEKVYFQDGSEEAIDGIFIAYETATSLDFARKLGIMTDGKAISVDREQKTNIDGLFAAGDCTGGFKQISVSVGQGALAGRKMIEYARQA